MKENKPDVVIMSSDWEPQPLSHFLRERKEKSDGVSEVHSVSVQYGVINQVDFLGRSYAAEDTSNYKLVYPYDVVYTKSPTGNYPYGIIKQNQNTFKVIVSPLYGVFRPRNKYIGYIIQSYFESPNTITKYLAPIIAKGAKNTIQISNDLFLSRNVYLPCQIEVQKKIAEFLSSIDKQIEQQRKELEALKQHKQALMQQLFPHIGNNKPRVRVVRSNQKWKVLHTEEVFIRVTERNNGQSDNVLTISAQFGLIKQQDFFDRTISNDIKDYYLIKKGDFTYNKSYSSQYPMGVIKPLKNYEDGVVSPLYICFRVKDGFVHDFFEHYFESGLFNYEIRKIAQEGARNHGLLNVSVKDFFTKTKLLVPTLVEEQETIAKTLSSINTIIEASEKKYELLKNHKRGLMQQLFPD